MELVHLRVRDFRNLASVDIAPGPRFNVISGHNGQGKTNLVEAVYVLGSVKTFRTQKNRELIRWDADRAVLEGLAHRGDDERLARIEVCGDRKEVYLGDLSVQRLADFFGTLNVVVFTPDDLSLVKGSPSERRRFLDRAIFNLRATYAGDAVGYDKILKQRNAMLKGERVDAVLLDVYDEQLALSGGRVASARHRFVEQFSARFAAAFGEIFGGLSATVTYESPWWDRSALPETPESAPRAGRILDRDDALVSSAQDALRAALARRRQEDMRRGQTSTGPHRDDLRVELESRSARTFASQGQQRALVLAMKIAEVEFFESERGFRPILLLDDVSSELDRARNRFLFDYLRAHDGQVFITTTHRDHILLEEDVVAYEVEAGNVRQVE